MSYRDISTHDEHSSSVVKQSEIYQNTNDPDEDLSSKKCLDFCVIFPVIITIILLLTVGIVYITTYLIPRISAPYNDNRYLAYWWNTEDQRVNIRKWAIANTAIFAFFYTLTILYFLVAMIKNPGECDKVFRLLEMGYQYVYLA